MICKFCGNELQPDEQICPMCGRKIENKSGVKLALMIGCVVLLVAVLVVAVLLGTGVLGGKQAEPTTAPSTEATTQQVDFDSYTAEDAVAAAKADEVVATVADIALTNSELQLHYWYQVYNFLGKYSYYLSAMGFDAGTGLDRQASYFDSSKSWQQYFLDAAINSWQSYAILSTMADAEGFTLGAEGLAYIESLPAKIQEDAVTYGYEDTAAMLLAEAGPGCTAEGYIHYLSLLYKSMRYFEQKYDEMTPTADEVEAYYAEKASTYEENGTGKDAGKTVDVRHILVSVEEDTEEAWAACLTEAERIYQEWKDGEATEESFAELANTYSSDPGSNTNGGLYTDVAEGDMLETFNDWIMDESRQTGDTGLVKTVHGYHIMYYVEDEDIWYTTASKDLRNERFAEFLSEAMEQYPMEVDYDKIVLGYISLVEE